MTQRNGGAKHGGERSASVVIAVMSFAIVFQAFPHETWQWLFIAFWVVMVVCFGRPKRRRR